MPALSLLMVRTRWLRLSHMVYGSGLPTGNEQLSCRTLGA